MKSKALAAPEPKKGKMELREYEVPSPGPDEVTVKTHYSIISPGTERAFVLGLDNTSTTFPFHPGYCSAGVVEQVGAKVTKVHPGQRVACHMGHRSAWTIPEKHVTPVPDGVALDHAGFHSLGVICTQGVRKARIELGESVMVLGLGIIGQLALQLARLNGGFPAMGVDRVAQRLAIAKECGADAVIDASQPTWQETLKHSSGGSGPHVVIEATGAAEPVVVACQVARPFGRIVLLASTRGVSSVNFYRDVHKPGLTIIGAHTSANPEHENRPGAWTNETDGDCFLRLLQAKRIRLDPLITHRVSWEKAVETYEAMLTWDTSMVGTVIDWTKA